MTSASTIIVPPDPAGNVLRDGHIAVDPSRGGGVPAGERIQGRPQHPALHRPYAPFTKIRVELIPRIAHGREAVTEMLRATGLDDRFRRAVARADHQIVLVEIELFDGGGEERQAVAIEALRCPARAEARTCGAASARWPATRCPAHETASAGRPPDTPRRAARAPSRRHASR